MENELQQVFIAEAEELFADLEKGLLALETDPENKECISNVFRAMHTLKGTAGMFGFDTINALTHHLESVYEAVRNGEGFLTPGILSITFESLDHFKQLLSDPKISSKSLFENHQRLLLEIENLAADFGKVGDKPTPVLTEETVQNSYYISIQPQGNILRNGTNTLYLLDDLLTLGSGIVLPYFKDLPALEDLHPEVSYTCFEVLLQTKVSEAAIRDVFMFVDTECEIVIQKIEDAALNFDSSTKDRLWLHHVWDRAQGLDALSAILATDKQEQTEKPEQSVEENQKTQHKSSIRVGSERLDELMNLVSELVTTQASLSLFAETHVSQELDAVSENIEKITRRLRDNAFKMSLIPLESLATRYQRLVRDLSKELNKEVVFKTEGTETEIDKSIIEKLTDPLLHLLRNALDHGIERPEERVKKGKPAQGTVLLRSYYAGASVIIEIKDDGAGIDVQKIKDKAISKGLLAPEASLSENELLNLIFLPGFSTAEKVTGVSGRGVGMDVVKRNITDIRGTVDISSKHGEGTTFTIKLPLTLSIIDGMLVEIDDTRFIIPLFAINKCFEVATSLLENTFNQWITLDGIRTPFLYLRREFGIVNAPVPLSQIINIPYQGASVGLAIDHIVGEYQAVVKPLGNLYARQDEFSGATILGDGSVALVIDPYKLIEKLIHTSTSAEVSPDAP